MIYNDLRILFRESGTTDQPISGVALACLFDSAKLSPLSLLSGKERRIAEAALIWIVADELRGLMSLRTRGRLYLKTSGVDTQAVHAVVRALEDAFGRGLEENAGD